MKQYRELCERILKEGTYTPDRTGTGTYTVFGHQSVYDLRKGFPLLTLKKTAWKAVVHELLWFIAGDTNIKYLLDNKVTIWNEWTPAYKYGFNGLDKNEAVKAAYEAGRYDLLQLGPVYGKQWRNWNGIDQLQNLLDEACRNPTSRRLIVSAWNPSEVSSMALPPCHTMWQVKLTPRGYSRGYFIDLQLYQRSADVFLGVPFNIASYSLLLMMIAKHIQHYTGLAISPRNFIHTLGDAHLYSNHIEQTKEMLSRKELPLPLVEVSEKYLTDMIMDDIILYDYESHPAIKAEVAV